MPQVTAWLQFGSFGLLALVVLLFVKQVIPAALQHMKDSQDGFADALARARAEFREDRREERAFLSGELEQNRSAVGGLARAVERQTVAIVAAAKDQDVDEALKIHEKRNGGDRSGATYS